MFKALVAFFTALALSPFAMALSYSGYASTVSRSGASFGCSDGGAKCCTMPTGYAYSARFSNLPAGTQGQGYTNTSCSAFLFHLFGPGTKCWNGGGARARSLNWFHSPSRRSVTDDQSDDEGCVPPSSFSYTDEKGAEKVIKVTSDEEAEEISALYAKKDFGTLAKFSPFEGEAGYIFQASPISDFLAV